MTDLLIQENKIIERILSMELVRVTERAAVSSARLRGRGDEKAADQAAVDAMRRELNRLPIHGTVVIGEGERDEAPMLFIGEEVGTKTGPKVDIALDPLEGTTLCAKDMPGSDRRDGHGAGGLAAQRARRLYGQDRHRPGLPARHRRSRHDAGREHPRAGQGQGRQPERSHRLHSRPAAPQGSDRRLPSRRRLDPPDHRWRRGRRDPCHQPDQTGVDLYLGTGGAPEGVLAAGALRCVGGQMQGRLILDTPEKVARAAKMGVKDPKKKYDMKELASGDVIVCATGVTDGALLSGVKFNKDNIETETVIYRSITGTVRRIKAEHREYGKFKLD
jgi:fructose-1,6-bisphosphatase II / sedoheptulose-1,7-bisphosphatase